MEVIQAAGAAVCVVALLVACLPTLLYLGREEAGVFTQLGPQPPSRIPGRTAAVCIPDDFRPFLEEVLSVGTGTYFKWSLC
ncbi:hypothetical protein B0T26DRAFT_501879 [Lasiosphaeria miniovina]|uniref:Uncharacterized protein n=1 Tax=Lasiosphaeria miniovina TaxID=1954250 RepID=A0AA39ZTW4_9PEZI|nr:uncharacterized protein B0T26DRAFT_501879 [Lasiosphaeria miniovina]KAK0703493.1 hypothetical protein B0T26DRAFT_501879 [Lasiosphaeria miniovina]